MHAHRPRGIVAPARRHGLGRGSRPGRGSTGGQALVEFALAFPIFLGLTIALIEFVFVFNAVLGVDFATRNAALAAAEAGSSSGADCAVLSAVEQSMGAPIDRTQITSVTIFRADAIGNPVVPAEEDVYSRTGSTTCTYPDGTIVTVPYSLSGTAGYADLTRCNVLLGCGGSRTTVDYIGVKLAYHHNWRTPYRNFFGGPTGGFDVVKANAMRMEPIL